MLDLIVKINGTVNNFVWGVPAMILIMGVGLYFTLGMKFIQIRKFPYAMRETIGKIFHKKHLIKTFLTIVSPFRRF